MSPKGLEKSLEKVKEILTNLSEGKDTPSKNKVDEALSNLDQLLLGLKAEQIRESFVNLIL